MKFKVKDGRIKDCILIERQGLKFWVTPNKQWMVAHEDGTPIDGCSVYEEPLEDAVFEEVMTMANTIVEIKTYLDSMGTSYVGVTAKAALLELC